MGLDEYIKKKEEEEPEPKKPEPKRKSTAKTPEAVVPEIEPMTDEEAVDFYVNLSNMAYMAINPKLRMIETEEVLPIKTAVGNVVRTSMKYFGDIKIYLDVAVMAGFTIGMYKQRKGEIITIDTKANEVKGE